MKAESKSLNFGEEASTRVMELRCNEEFSVEGNGCQFDVLSVENKMIGKVRVKKLSDQVAEDAQTCQNEEKMVE